MKKNILSIVIFACLLYGFSAMCILSPKAEFSVSERRPLASMPQISVKGFLNGSFAEGFEEFATDTVPFRDGLRSVKAFFATTVLKKAENNGVFVTEGHISKIDNPVNDDMMDYAADKFSAIADRYVKEDSGCRLYLSIIPDKNYVLPGASKYPVTDYELLAQKMQERIDFMEYIDIYPILDKDDFYFTDSHWKQEEITHVAEHIATAMGRDVSARYTKVVADENFRGVYAGQLALKTPPDTLCYLTNPTLENATVTYYDTGMPKEGSMYNMDKLRGKDPYEMFLSGAAPVVTMDNPNPPEDGRELIVFRDSFGSSIGPLFLEGYSRVTLLDIRYVNSGMLSGFADFENADVLFLYCASLLNSSTALR